MQTELQETRASAGGTTDDLSAVQDTAAAEFFELQVPGRPGRVFIAYSAIQNLRGTFDAKGERLGLLLGSSSREGLWISRCELVPPHPNGFKPVQLAFGDLLKARLEDPGPEAPLVVGVFRTMMGGWLGLGESDRNLAKHYLTASGSIFMLIQTTAHRPWLAALFALEGNGTPERDRRGREFLFDEYLLRNGYLTDLIPTPDQPAPPVGFPRSYAGWIRGALVVSFLLLVSTVYYWSRPIDQQRDLDTYLVGSGALGLRVSRSGGDFEVFWDRSSLAVRGSPGGTLTIRDGGVTRTLPLDAEQLQEGRVLYTPLFGDLSFRLEVAGNDHRTQAESVDVLGWNGSASDPATGPVAGGDTRPAPLAAASPGGPWQAHPANNLPPSTVPIVSTFRADSARSNALRGDPAKRPAVSTPVMQEGSKIPQAPEALENRKAIERRDANSGPSDASAASAVPDSGTPPTPSVSANQLPEAALPSATGASLAPVAEWASSTPPATPASSRPDGPGGPPAFVAPTPIQRVNPLISSQVAEAWRKTGTGKFTVSVRVSIDVSGNVQNVEVTEFTGGNNVDTLAVKSAALRGASLWRFSPGTLNGQSIPSEYTIQFAVK